MICKLILSNSDLSVSPSIHTELFYHQNSSISRELIVSRLTHVGTKCAQARTLQKCGSRLAGDAQEAGGGEWSVVTWNRTNKTRDCRRGYSWGSRRESSNCSSVAMLEVRGAWSRMTTSPAQVTILSSDWLTQQYSLLIGWHLIILISDWLIQNNSDLWLVGT